MIRAAPTCFQTPPPAPHAPTAQDTAGVIATLCIGRSVHQKLELLQRLVVGLGYESLTVFGDCFDEVTLLDPVRFPGAMKIFAREICRNDLLSFGRLHFFFPDRCAPGFNFGGDGARRSLLPHYSLLLPSAPINTPPPSAAWAWTSTPTRPSRRRASTGEGLPMLTTSLKPPTPQRLPPQASQPSPSPPSPPATLSATSPGRGTSWRSWLSAGSGRRRTPSRPTRRRAAAPTRWPTAPRARPPPAPAAPASPTSSKRCVGGWV
jgi:hypothetical protein